MKNPTQEVIQDVELDPTDDLLKRLRGQGDAPKLPTPKAWNPDYPLRPFQRVGAAHLLVKRRYVLGDPTGSGKTPQCLFSWGLLREARLEEDLVPRLWVVTTKSAVKQWEEEVNKFLPEIQVYRVRSEEDKKKRVATVKRWTQDKTGAVLIVNWTQFAIDWPDIQAGTPVESWLPETQIVLDEAQKMKNPSSRVGKTAKRVMQEVDRALALTATLVRNKAHDAHAIVETICPGTMSLVEFEKLYCKKRLQPIMVKGRRMKIPVVYGYHDLEGFAKVIAPVYLGRSDEEIEGQRPDVTFMKRTVKMSAEQRKVYLEAERGFLLDDPDAVGAPALIHAQQAANNPEIWYDRTDLSVRTKDNAKAALLLELLEEELADEPIILYSPLETTISAFQKYLTKYNPVRVTGKEASDDERQRARLAFQNGETNIIMITDAGGEGLNLQRAKHVIFLSRWAPGQYVQVVGRARRFGSEHKSVTVWHLSCEDTIDELADAVLSEKFGPVEDIVRGRGKLVPEDQVMPRDIVEYAMRRRKFSKNQSE